MNILEKENMTDEEVKRLESHPVSKVSWIPLSKITSNAWNPNSVAKVEMDLLMTSILKDKFVQPITTYYDPDKDKYIIVDGFHRYTCIRLNNEINEMCCNRAPCSVIEKDLNELMSSTVRLNRARGSHSVEGMSSMVFDMLDNGWTEAEVCAELGMEAEEIVRLKHITGFSKLFENAEYSREWKTKRMIKESREYKEGNQ